MIWKFIGKNLSITVDLISSQKYEKLPILYEWMLCLNVTLLKPVKLNPISIIEVLFHVVRFELNLDKLQLGSNHCDIMKIIVTVIWFLGNDLSFLYRWPCVGNYELRHTSHWTEITCWVYLMTKYKINRTTVYRSALPTITASYQLHVCSVQKISSMYINLYWKS